MTSPSESRAPQTGGLVFQDRIPPSATAENTASRPMRAACSDNYIPMREHPKRLYEQTHSGAVHFACFIGEKLASTLPPAIMGSLLSLGEKIELPGGTAMPYETTFGRIALGVTGVLVIFDVANTWTEDSGNTNFKRLQKTGIQMVGGAATVAGGMASASLIVMGERELRLLEEHLLLSE